LPDIDEWLRRMNSLFKSVALEDFDPAMQPLLSKLKETCEEEVRKRGLEAREVDCFVAAAGVDGLLDASFFAALGNDVEELIHPGNLDFIAAYALDSKEFDCFWIMVAENFDTSSLIELEQQAHEYGLTSLMRRIGFKNKDLRDRALGALLEKISRFGAQSEFAFSKDQETPWQMRQSKRAADDIHTFIDIVVRKNSGLSEDLPMPESCESGMTVNIGSQNIQIDPSLVPLLEPLQQRTAEGLERILDLAVYNRMTMLQVMDDSVESICAEIQPLVMPLLSYYGYRTHECKALFRQLIVNGLSDYPRLKVDLAATDDEMMGRSPMLAGNKRMHSLVRTLSGPYGVFGDRHYVPDAPRLANEKPDINLFNLHDSHLSRTSVIRSVEFPGAPGDSTIVGAMIKQRKFFVETVAYLWSEIARLSNTFDDETYVSLIEYHMKATLDHPSLLGVWGYSGNRLLRQRPHLMHEVVDVFSSLSEEGVDQERLSQLAVSMEVDAAVLLNHQAFIASQVMRADMLGHDLGL
jgi:hypothetical protein